MLPSLLAPPRPSVPRVGDKVRWHEKDIVHIGTYLGHRYVREKNGQLDRCTPIVRSELLGQEVPVYSFDVIRLDDPNISLGPNWDRLPTAGSIKSPDDRQTQDLRQLLDRV